MTGPDDITAVGPLAPSADDPPWLTWARGELGQHEAPGPASNNERIVWYHSFTTLKATSDATPWCSSFVCAAMSSTGYSSTRSAAAVSWVRWGRDAAFKPGVIVVVKNRLAVPSPDSPYSGFHVAFGLREHPEGLILLGGNQSDSVCARLFRTSAWELKAMRWPANWP